ncbi:vacuolar fusion protein MON1 homolog isoform X1 [Nymphaea colorata]|nr:vacuolar fusion protein MON1 homolog isoform X1 [Nymphaea colorata]
MAAESDPSGEAKVVAETEGRSSDPSSEGSNSGPTSAGSGADEDPEVSDHGLSRGMSSMMLSTGGLPVGRSGVVEDGGVQLREEPKVDVVVTIGLNEDESRGRTDGVGEVEQDVERNEELGTAGIGSSSEGLGGGANGLEERKEDDVELREESAADDGDEISDGLRDGEREPGEEVPVERVEESAKAPGVRAGGLEEEEEKEVDIRDRLISEGVRLVSVESRGGEEGLHEEDVDRGDMVATSNGISLFSEPEGLDNVEEPSASIMWRENTEQEEVPSSPSSSGYAGERGSSSAGSMSSMESGDSIRRDDGEGTSEIRPFSENSKDSGSNWIPGKRHLDEVSPARQDDASISWRKRKKHFFILSNSGKPIYSRYGDEHKLAGFSATLQAIISFVENGGDRVQLVRAGKHQVVFLVKGPIYLVCISCTDEPYEALRGQLELIYGQMLVILTKSVNRCFEKNPKFDMTPLLGGTDVVFSSLIHAFSRNPASFLHAYTCLPLAYSTRQAAGAILQDVADSGVLFAILMCKHKVISLVGAQKASLHPDDMLLLSNFVLSSESFRTSESFSPICLPRFNPMAFLYAYVSYLDVDTYLMLLTTSSDAFYHLKDCRFRIENVLLKSNVLCEVQRSELDGGLRVEDLPLDTNPRSGSASPHLGQERSAPGSPTRAINNGVGGPAGLWHFMYRSIYLDQYVASEFSPPLQGQKQQKRLYRGYQRLYVSMHDKLTGPHKTQFRRDEDYVLLCWITPDFELYAAFDPLADKATAISICNRVCQWVRDVENEIFLLGASPFSW